MFLNLITCMAVIYGQNLHPAWLLVALVAWIAGRAKVNELAERVEYIHKIVTETVKARTGKEEP